MPKKIRSSVQHFLIQTNRIPFFFSLSKHYYRAGIFMFSCLAKFMVPEIVSIYVRNSYVNGDWIPWVSDVDFTLTLACDSRIREAAALARFWRLHKIVAMVFPFIQHIGIFSSAELSHILESHNPSFSLVMGNIRKVGEKDVHVFLQTKTPSSLCIHDWIRFFDWLSRRNCSSLVSYYRYERFLRKFPPLCPASDDANELVKLLHDQKQVHDAFSFARSGFYYANNIVASFHDECIPRTAAKSSFQQYAIPERYPDTFLKQADDFASQLKVYADAIAGVAVDPGSLCSRSPRIWIFMRHGINKVLWEEVVGSIWILEQKKFQGLQTYVFDEYAIALFLHTQRYWAFEYAHLMNHRDVMWGEDTIAAIPPVPDEFVRNMALPSRLIKRAALREIVFRHSWHQLPEAANELVRLRLLCQHNLLVTTRAELTRATSVFSKEDPYFFLEESIRQRRVDRRKLFEVWSECA